MVALLGLFLLPGCGGGSDGDVIYWCSMHPDVRQPEPGTCPLCGGMRLVPLDQTMADGDGGVLLLSDAQVQQAGVRTRSADVVDLVRVLDLSARFELNPQSEVTIHNPIPGSSRVAKVHYELAGQQVKEGTVLLELENELLAQQVDQLRDALERYEDLKQQEGRERQAAEMLKRKDAILKQIIDAGVERGHAMLLVNSSRLREKTPTFPVQSTQAGIILRTPIVEVGRYSRQGEALFRIADTSQLWLELDAQLGDLAWLQAGQRVEYSTPAVPERTFWTTLDAVETVADSGRPETRVRARATSARGRILPGAWARARVQVPADGVLAVPATAVMRTGGRDVALVAEGGGRFRPVALTLGRRDLQPLPAAGATNDGTRNALRTARFHEVLEGLTPGDRVVTAGSFLLLSEASFQGALEKVLSGDELDGGLDTSPELSAALDTVLAQYEALRAALAGDEPDGLQEPAAALSAATTSLPYAGLPPSTVGALERLGEAARELERIALVERDLEVARVAFGSVSREVVALIRDHGRERVDGGQLILFRCPMADDYGFDLWFQTEAQMANPYMGQRMLECGSEAQL